MNEDGLLRYIQTDNEAHTMLFHLWVYKQVLGLVQLQLYPLTKMVDNALLSQGGKTIDTIHMVKQTVVVDLLDIWYPISCPQ